MKTKKLMALVIWAGLFGQLPAQAFFINPQLEQTFGSNQYEGTTASVDFGDAFHLMPTFYDYHSNLTDPNGFRTYSLRAAYDTSLWGIGVSGGATPKTAYDAYSNTFFGVDGIISLSPGTGEVNRLQQYHSASASSQPGGWQSPPEGLAQVTLGAGLTYIDHKADIGAAGAGGTQDLGQTNVRGSVGLAFLDNLLSADLTKAIYNGSLATAGLQGSPVQILPGLSGIIQGFPDVSANIKLSMGMVPIVTPYISYTHTTFELGQTASGAYTVGASMDLLMLKINAFYERYVEVGLPDQNLIGLGAGLNF